MARELHGTSWREHRNEPLDQLFPAIWLDEFEDKATYSLLLSPDEVEQHRKGFAPLPDRTPVRVLLWRILPKADYWTPDAVRNAREGEYLWQEMAALPWDDYDDEWRRRIIEHVVILGSAFERWKAQYWSGRPGKKKRQAERSRDPLADAKLKNQIETVLTIARRQFPNPNKRPSVLHMAEKLVEDHRDKINYSKWTVKKILIGTYPTAQRLGFSGLT